MKIIFNNLVEAKKFLDMVNLSKLCADEREWGALGLSSARMLLKKAVKNQARKPF